ncbi:hypothetical protein ADUPG1_002405, partial [Aduncisulcus paluster]
SAKHLRCISESCCEIQNVMEEEMLKVLSSSASLKSADFLKIWHSSVWAFPSRDLMIDAAAPQSRQNMLVPQPPSCATEWMQPNASPGLRPTVSYGLLLCAIDWNAELQNTVWRQLLIINKGTGCA